MAISEFSIDDLVAEIQARKFSVFKNTKSGAKEMMGTAFEYLTDDEMLSSFDEEQIKDYLEDDGYYVIDKDDKSSPNFFKRECIELFKDLSNRKGFDFVYALLEPHKLV